MKKFFCVCITLLSLCGCKKFLDAKPDKKLLLPATVEAVQGLLDNDMTMNLQYPATGEISADNYYVTDVVFNSINSQAQRNTYLWKEDITLNEYPNHWSRLYDIVTIANVCLESLNRITPAADKQLAWNNARGSALLYRARALMLVIGYFTKAYNISTASTDMGIPLRLNSDYNITSTRASLQASYDQVITDLREAAGVLPVVPRHVMQPSRPAAFGLLSRTFLLMNAYDSALAYADRYLGTNSMLLNLNSLNTSATFPFPLYNAEVCMHSIISTPLLLSNIRALVDSSLYRSYDLNDLRRSLYFKTNTNGTIAFRGSYNQSASMFNGVVTDEIYLIKAECLARTAKITEAITTLNTLMMTRWKTGTFIPFSAGTLTGAMKIILTERRKELIFRDQRWMDLKRLNLEADFQTTVFRRMNGVDYSLPPNDNRYALPLPATVIEMSGIEQNPR